MVFAIKHFVVLACLGFLRLVVSYNVKVHVVSNQDAKGGNCLTADLRYVCSDKTKTYYTKVKILSSSEGDSSSAVTYGIGFLNACFDRWTMISQLTITWSKITSQRNIYFRDDQCFWSTQEGRGYIYKDDQGVKLCLKDQRPKLTATKYLNPFEKPGKPGYSEQNVCVTISHLPEGTQDQEALGSDASQNRIYQATNYQPSESSPISQAQTNGNFITPSSQEDIDAVVQPLRFTSNELPISSGSVAQGEPNIELKPADLSTKDNGFVSSSIISPEQNAENNLNSDFLEPNPDSYQDPVVKLRKKKRTSRPRVRNVGFGYN